MKKCPTVAEWLKLDVDTRRQLVLNFGIPKTGIPETMNGLIICDGVTQKDLMAFDIPKMMEYLQDNLSFYREDLADYLFDMLIRKFRGEVIEAVGIMETEELEMEELVQLGQAKPRRGRPKKEVLIA